MRRCSRKGLGFDGSSIRGWQPINASDMLVVPDPTTAVMDPFMRRADAVADLQHRRPDHQGGLHARPAQHRAQGRGVSKSTGVGDTAYFGPEPEFFIFDDVRYDAEPAFGLLLPGLDRGAVEHAGATRSPNLGYKPRYKEGYFPVPPTDSQQDIRTEMVRTMEAVGHAGREAAPRGGNGRPGGDRHALPAAGEDGRRAEVVQVHRQERGAQARQDGHLHAEADLRRQRQRHAHPPVASGRARSRCLPATATAA